ncbi:hypothetical protein WN51_13094, partial [Melipona quadrifasciata]
YIVLEETKRGKIRVRALSFVKGIKEGIGRLVLKECLKEKEEGRQKTRSMEEREGYLRRNALSGLGLDQERGQRRKSKKIIENLRRRDIERQKQAQYEKIQRSRYNERYKGITMVGIPEYPSKVCLCILTYVCTYEYVYICVYMYVYMYVCARARVCVCIYVCMHIDIYVFARI